MKLKIEREDLLLVFDLALENVSIDLNNRQQTKLEKGMMMLLKVESIEKDLMAIAMTTLHKTNSLKKDSNISNRR